MAIPKKPNFFLVGAPKCGTTSMIDYLRDHPRIFIPLQKEFHFFGSDLKYSKPRNFTRDQYLAAFQNAGQALRLGEGSVFYLYSRNAAREIYDFDPHAKIIIMLRNPVDMLYSHFSQLLYSADEDITDFQAALAAEPDRKAGRRIPANTWMIDFLFYRDIAKYTNQVKRYRAVFPLENVHIIIFDDFKTNTSREFYKTLEFLEISTKHRPDFSVRNPNKEARNKALQVILRHPPGILRDPVRRILSRDRIYKLKGFIRKLNTRNTTRPELDPALANRLRREYLPEIERLSHLLDRDLTGWCRIE